MQLDLQTEGPRSDWLERDSIQLVFLHAVGSRGLHGSPSAVVQPKQSPRHAQVGRPVMSVAIRAMAAELRMRVFSDIGVMLLLLFPLMGERIVQLGVRVKALFKPQGCL